MLDYIWNVFLCILWVRSQDINIYSITYIYIYMYIHMYISIYTHRYMYISFFFFHLDSQLVQWHSGNDHCLHIAWQCHTYTDGTIPGLHCVPFVYFPVIVPTAYCFSYCNFLIIIMSRNSCIFFRIVLFILVGLHFHKY